ncbi:ATP-binding protein [Proteinivorax hydrogeniformans]|uniref:ATP-binding protein n=1 Tax=Proteinivorax hydrogeniformans TaxID=1826727 RepID=A0AAU8HSJ0_9FIRM
MKSEKSKIQGIVKELVSNSLNAEAEEINVTINNKRDYTKITVSDDGKGMNEKILDEVNGILNQPRRDELEEYYGDLAGNTGSASGLNIVSMLVDKGQAASKREVGTKISVLRKK